MNNNVEQFATLSRFAIAASIVYFAYQLAQISQNLFAIELKSDSGTGRLLFSVDVSARLKAKVTGLIIFSGVFDIPGSR